eukprot:scaffold20412_cov90-Isochrysis_galbana.AAC.1
MAATGGNCWHRQGQQEYLRMCLPLAPAQAKQQQDYAPRCSKGQSAMGKLVQQCSLLGRPQPASVSTFGARAVHRRLRASTDTHRSRSSESFKVSQFEALERIIAINLRGGGGEPPARMGT